MVQVEVNGEDAQYSYVWCRERLMQKRYSMCGAGRG